MRTSRRWLLFIFICLMPFQDTILQATPLQRLGSTFAVLPLILLVFLDVAERLLKFDFRFRRFLVLIACYAGIVTLWGILQYGSGFGSAALLWQAIKLSVDSALALYVIFGVDYSDSFLVRRAVKIALLITLIGILACDFNFLGLGVIGNSGFLHQTPHLDPYDHRWRGLTKEPSVLAPLLMGMSLLSAHYARTPWGVRIYWILGLALTAIGASKGGVVSMLLILLIIFLLRAKTSLWKAIPLMIVAAPIFVLGSYILLPQFGTSALRASNSIATRLTMHVWAGLILLHSPAGIGFGAMAPAIGRYLGQAMRIAQSLLPIPLSFVEVRTFLYDSEAAGAKSLAANFAVYFGVPFLIAASVASFRMVKQLYRLGYIALLACVLFLIFELCTSVDSLAYYNLYLPFGIAVCEIRRHANSTCNA